MTEVRVRLPVLAFMICFVLALSAMSMPVAAYSGPDLFIVSPSGDTTGVTDWTNMMNAFDDAVAAGPGSTVQLEEGVFYLNRPVQVADFDGTFKGAGMMQTIVRDAVDGLFGLAQAPLPRAPYFFEFYQSEMGYSRGSATHVRIADMTTQVTGFTEWGLFAGYIWVTSRYADDGTPLGGFVDCDINSVRMIGETSLDGVNLWAPQKSLNFMPMTGTFKVTNSYIEYQRRGVFMLGLVDSLVTIGGHPGAGNEFWGIWTNARVGGAAVAVISCYDSRFVFSHSGAYDTGGLWVYQGFWPFTVHATPSSSEFLMMKNTIRTTSPSWYGGVEVYDDNYHYDGIPTIDMKIIDNTFIGYEFMELYAPIFIVDVNDGMIVNNKFIGEGITAIHGGVWDSSFSNWKILANDFRDFNSYIADIGLTYGSSDCLVVASSYLTTVIDHGTGNRLLGRIELVTL